MRANRVLLFISLLLFASIANSVTAQETDVAKLVHPDVAERLSLVDTQRAAIQNLVQRRAEALAAEKVPAAREKTKAEFNQQILAILTEEQQAKFLQSPTPKKLMFQFREMKWDDVLEWFAGQQDLTLVMDQVPPGAFTYSDTRSYSPSEGIDLLNSVLMTRNFTLVRREKMLVVMALNDSIPIELLPRVKLDELAQRGRFELVSVIFPLGGRPVEDVLQEVKPFLSNFGRALPLAKGTQVLVLESAGKMQTINEIIASVPLPKKAAVKPDPEPAPQPVFASYTLGGLDAVRAYEMIRKLIASEQITVDPKTGILSAFLIPAQHTAVKLAIDAMLESAQKLPAPQSVAYQLSGALPEDVKKQILALAPNVTVSAAVDRLLVTGTAEDQQLIRASLMAIDILPVDSSKSMKVFDLDTTVAALAESSLKAFLPKGQIVSNKAGSLIVRGSDDDIKIATEVIDVLRSSPIANPLSLKSFPLEQTVDAKWLLTLQKIVPNANTWLADEGKQLVLMGSKADISVVENLLPQLISLVPKPDQRKLQIYTLTKLQLARRASLTDLPSNLLTMKVVDSTNKQELMVWGTVEQHTAFAKLLEGLDQPSPATPSSLAKVYPLNVENSALIVQILTAEFPESKVTADVEGESLTVIADEVTQSKIGSRIIAFNDQLPKKRELTLETYSVRGMTAASLQLTLTPLLTKAKVNVDSVKNRLLVTADAKIHQDIAKLITAMSEKIAVDQQPVVVAYSIQHALPSQIKIVFDQLALGTTSIADDKLRQLVVTGPLDSQATAKATIAQIDRPSDLTGPKEIRSYEAKKLQAAALIPTLQKLWPDMQLTADATANRVIATGTTKDLDQLDEAMQKLISSPDGKPQFVKTYPVPAGDMLTLATILGQIAPQAIVSSDILSRTVTVWAGEEQHTRVQQALEEISKTAQAAKAAATYQVKPTQVLAVQTALVSLFPTIGVASVPTSGQLIVVASPEQQKRISEVIELLASGPNAMDKTIRVFRIEPDQIELASMLGALQSTLPSQIRLESNIANNTILAIGTPEELDMVTAKVAELEKQLPAPEVATSVVYQLHHGSTAGANVILATLVPKATLVYDPALRTIAATAKPNDHKKIVDILKQYDLPKATATYNVKPTQVTMVLTSLRTLFPLAEMTSDPLTGRLIVIASTEQQTKIEEIIELMVNGPNAAEKTIKVFMVDQERVDQTSLLSALQLTLPSQIRLESNPKNGTILAIGSPEELKLVADKLAQLQQELPTIESNTTVVYPLKYGTPLSALTILQSLVPRAVVVQDIASKTISASAKAHEHKQIQEFLRSFDIPKTTSLDTHVYRLRQGSALGLAAVLTSLMPDATVFGSREEGVLVATASPEQHKRIEAIVKDFDVDMQNSETRVFSIGKGSAATLKLALQGFSPKATSTADTTTNSLIVTAPKEEMERIALIVTEVEMGGSKPKHTKYYSLNAADPISLAKSLLESFPKSGFAADSISGGLFATATEEDHVAIERVVEEVNLQPTKLPSMRAFVLKNASPSVVADAIQNAFGRRSTAGVTFSRDAKSVFVVASHQDLLIAEQLIEQLDVPKSTKEEKRLQLFSLNGADSKSVTTSIESLFKEDSSSVDVRYDPIKEQLFVTGKESQLKLVEEAVKQFAPPKREFEIIQLNSADPFSFKRAADALFEDEPYSTAPSISVDSSQQQVLVRATKEQLESIRGLLKQMGEKQFGAHAEAGSGRIRIVPIHRGSRQLLQEVQRLWPTLRNNPINLVNPQTLDKKETDNTIEPKPALPPKQDDVGSFRNASPMRLTSAKVDENEVQTQTPTLSPIIVVIGEDQWTLASDDSEALDLFARLLDTLMNPKVTPVATAGEFSVYILRHADAKHLREVLAELFRTGESGRRNPLSEAFQRVKIVADSRINALVIGGNRADRKIIEELLAVFDSEDLLDTLQQISPTVVQLKSVGAKNVLDIVKEVYKAQLKSDAGREPIEIPEGVSGEVAVMLQQLNAQSSGPLLSAATDEASNSIILRGPPSLLLEVKGFIEKIDNQSSTASARRVQVLRLESTNTKNLEKALNLLKGK